MKEIEGLNKGDAIKAEIYSRDNYWKGRYKASHIGLDDLSGIKNSDIYFLETLKMKADLADKMFVKAELEGKDMADPNVMKELGEKINAVGTPINRKEAIMTAVFVSLQLMVYYGVAIGIWGVVFKKSFLLFGFYGVIIGLLIGLFAAPVIVSRRTKAQIREISFSVGLMSGNSGIIIGVLGLVVLVIRWIFF